MKKVLLCPERVRRIPAQFSWIDQRLAHHRYFEHASSQAWALYLFLLTVADAQGLSYYADPTLCHRLGMQAATLAHARQGLLRLFGGRRAGIHRPILPRYMHRHVTRRHVDDEGVVPLVGRNRFAGRGHPLDLDPLVEAEQPAVGIGQLGVREVSDSTPVDAPCDP